MAHRLCGYVINSMRMVSGETNRTGRALCGKYKKSPSSCQMKLPQHERCFYEIILGESAQKPHFDLDIDNINIDGEDVKDNLVDNIVEVLI